MVKIFNNLSELKHSEKEYRNSSINNTFASMNTNLAYLMESFESDPSYYDETEDFSFACLNTSQVKDKKLHELTKDDQDPELFRKY